MEQTIVNDLTTLSSLDTSIILHHIKKKHQRDEIYIYIGDILIAVNPFKELPLYTEKAKLKYRCEKDPPHIYWTAERAFKHVQSDGSKQCIIVTGDSGAGKTETTKHILDYLVSRSECSADSLVDKLNKVNPLVELFGNASTVLNKNSSRFGKLVEIFYSHDMHLMGGRMQSFVLEQSRVVEHCYAERNFHVFHAFFAGLESRELEEFCLSDNPNDYRIMKGCDFKPHTFTGSRKNETEMYTRLYEQGLKIMEEIGFTEMAIRQIYEILAACLLLGNIEFRETDERGGLSPCNMSYVTNVLKVLGAFGDDCSKDILTEFRTAFVSKQFQVKGLVEWRFLSISQANDGRDALIKSLYDCLFRGIIDSVNDTIQGGSVQRKSSDLSISILDISGFENLERNGFEQLFINITNEKIQQYYQRQIFDNENYDYRKERIDVDAFEFSDNKEVLDLFHKKPGILSILHDQMLQPESDDKKLVQAFDGVLNRRKHYKQTKDELTFKISHYAGEVTYNSMGFLTKNRGTKNEQLCRIILENTDNDFIKNYFDAEDNLLNPKIHAVEDSLPKRQVGNLQRNCKLVDSYSNQYQESLRGLIEKLSEGSPLFVRCIKPNNNQQSNSFDDDLVSRQLEGAGILDVTNIRKKGYPVRLPFDVFFQRYKRLIENRRELKFNGTGSTDPQRILSDIGVKDFKMGKTKIFMKEIAIEQLSDALDALTRKEELERERIRQHEMESARKLRSDQSTVRVKNKDDDNQDFSNIHDYNDAASSISDTSKISNPPSYVSVEMENQPEVKQRRAWDVFRITERDDEDNEQLEKQVLILCRIIMYIALFIGIISKGAATTIIPLLLSSSLNNSGQDSLPKSIAATQLIMCYCVPIGLTFVTSVWKVVFGREKCCKIWKIIPVVIMESAQACGTGLLLFKILPACSTMSGVTISLTTLLCPAVVNLRKEYIKSSKRTYKWKIICHILSISACLIQTAAIVSIGLGPKYYFSYKDESAISDDRFSDWYLLVLALILFSLGYCENFIHGKLFESWKKNLQNSRAKINVFLSPLKITIFITMAVNMTPDYEFKLRTYEREKYIIEDIGLMLIYIYSSVVIRYEATLACRLRMQRLAFFVPLLLVPWSCFGFVYYFCSYGNNVKSILEGQLVCPDVDIRNWIATFTVLWLSMGFLSWHAWIPECNRMDKVERLFVLPLRDSIFTAIGILLKRKDDYFERGSRKHSQTFNESTKRFDADDNVSINSTADSSSKTSDVKGQDRPFVYVCGTMWHETKTEMLQLLKSLFRLDFHRILCLNAKKLLKETRNVTTEDLEYFDSEVHIIFDDAFCDETEKGKGHGERIPNAYVEQLVSLVYKAASAVAKGNIEWDSSPIKITTPYGGQLIWTMPGGTKFFCHLKDKTKIRHRKRWSQIMYMYYLLGYKLMGYGTEKDVVGECSRRKNPFARRGPSLLNHLGLDKNKKAQNTFLLTLDGDVDFKPRAVDLLLDKMKTNKKVGAVCGRIHPIGTGPIVWYQQFEYAIGHWLQKATEHVFGCVMCCPGAFSLFRGSAVMDDNVMRMYATPPSEAKHYIQFEQGEDRWLCTLMLQQGWKIDYAASADAWTFAPETFKDFYVQRRRWAPSTLANIIDLLSSWRTTTKVNDNISTPFIFYQFIILASSLLGIGTICLMIAGSLNAVLKLSMWYSFAIAILPVVFYATVCFKCTNDRQIFAAEILTSLYTIVMVFVTVGMLLNIASEPVYSPNVVFVFEILFVFVSAGICHPKELFCLVHGILYYLTVPSTFIFLTVYYMCNINVVSWGTREGPKKDEDDKPKALPKKSDSALVSCIKSTGITTLVRETTQLIRQLLGRQSEHTDEFIETNEPAIGNEPLHNKSNFSRDRNKSVRLVQDPDYWTSMAYLGNNKSPSLKDTEKEFWEDIIKQYLYPLVKNEEKEKQIQEDLKSLRNNVALGFFLINFLFALAIVQLQASEDQLKSFYLLQEYEPLSVAFLLIFATIIAIQFFGMISHRWGTFLHLISSVEIAFKNKKQDINTILNNAKKLQDLEGDALEDESLCGIMDNNINNDNIIPDYPDDETPNIYSKTFNENFKTLKKNARTRFRQHQQTTSSRRYAYDNQFNEAVF